MYALAIVICGLAMYEASKGTSQTQTDCREGVAHSVLRLDPPGYETMLQQAYADVATVLRVP